MKKCGICGIELSDKPYVYVSADGELSLSFLEMYGIKYIFCPQCTDELNLFLNELCEEKKTIKLKNNGKIKILKMSDYKK